MILFKACPRCGGDIDATYPEDSFFVQCAHRPHAVKPGPQLVHKTPSAVNSPAGDSDLAALEPVLTGQAGISSCPRCGSVDHIRLDRLRQRDNTCYRCRLCGHIFSPADGKEERQRMTQR